MSSAQRQEQQVALSLWEPSGVNREVWPVTFGVPFPRGALKDAGHISLWDTDREIPAIGRVTARWDDGSISWLLLDFAVGLRGNERKRLSLRFGEDVLPTVKPEAIVSVEEKDGAITVTNGDMQIAFKSGGHGFAQSAHGLAP